ncbi:serine hydrolase domain-containing protein [Lachnospira multipara]|uniref:serine hydrolase domain-containing protein n=1 Tax=Lachnospira multipara TaxID=28051 RepID=UPI0006923D99|nr:serine hydrolase [Lachnospira multipara]
MTDFFTHSTNEDTDIPKKLIMNFQKRLEKAHLPMHSIMIMRHDKLIYESHYAPYTRDSLHRMFSVTKSFVSLGIGLLADEGKLSLDDKIIDYFPDKLPQGEIHPFLKMMTIRDMLQMKSCHRFTTYKASGCNDWLGSFFTTTPTHVPGTNFAYDTSATHTLGILIERLTGMNFLDYLRHKFLDELEFSKDAYVLKDPSGLSMGGSGLNCSPYDLLKVMYLVVKKGNWFGKQLLPEWYIKEATSFHSDNWAKSDVIEEMQGYGYQFWLTTHNGFAMYGMGGQLSVYIPKYDIILITTADAQGRKGGVQLIYDSFYDELIDRLDSYDYAKDPVSYDELMAYASSRKLEVMPKFTDRSSNCYNDILDKINGRKYEAIGDNVCTVKNFSIEISDDKESGIFHYSNSFGDFSLPFGLGKNIISKFANYNLRIAACASLRTCDLLDIKIQVIDEVLGNLYFALNFKDPFITVMMRKIEEHTFNEYDGVFSAKIIEE